MTATGGKKGRNCCVVGGGMMGLTVAYRLVQAGHRVTLLEAAPNLGGLASAWHLEDVRWDRHYHVILMSDSHLRNLLGELGLDESIRWHTTRTGFYADGQLHPLNNAIDFLRLPVIGPIDKFRLAALIVYASRIGDGKRLERIPLSDWLIRFSGRRTFEQIWRPLLRAKLGDNYTKASASFIWAVIRRLYAARRSRLKTEMFGYVPGGYARILACYAERLEDLGVRVLRACPVQRIEQAGGQIRVKSAKADERFDQVVVTLPAQLAVRLCVGLSDEERQRLDRILYQGVVCASLLLRRPLAGNYLTYITDDTIPYTAVVEMSALVDPAEFGGHTLVYLPRYVIENDPFLQLSDEEIEKQFLRALVAMYPGLRRDDILCFRISRARHVLAVSTLDYSRHLPPMNTSVPGLHIVNSAHIVNGTLNVNETVALAESAMPQLLSEEAVHAT